MVLKILITALVIEIILLKIFGLLAKTYDSRFQIKEAHFCYGAVAVIWFAMWATVGAVAIKIIWGWL